MKLPVLLTIMLSSSIVFGQKQKPVVLSTQAEVQAFVTKDLDKRMADGDLRLWATENNIKGEYIMDITLYKKGQILTVFMVGSDADDLPTQNRVKNHIRTLRFHCKLPKGRNYKVSYTFIFD